LEANQLIFRKEEDEEERVVPRPEDRQAIVTRAHQLGHFQVEATLSQRLKQNYYWKGMNRDVEMVDGELRTVLA
jgi:hypothetical protein